MRYEFRTLLAAFLFLSGCGKKDVGGDCGDARLEGTYMLQRMEIGGVSSKIAEGETTCIFEGDRMIIAKGKKEDAAIIKCDPNKNPAEITITKKELSGKLDTAYGIYRLEADTLTLCLIKSDNPADRPTQFATKDSKAMLQVFKKVK